MNIKDWLGEESIFKEISLIIPEIISQEESETLDLLFSTYYSERTLFSSFLHISVKQAAEMIVLKYGNIWVKYAEVENLEGVGDITIVEDVTNSEDVKTNSIESKDLVAAYNEAELIENSGSNTSGLDNSSGEVIRNVKTSVAGVEARFNQLQLLNDNSIMNKMLEDVSNAISLNIY